MPKPVFCVKSIKTVPFLEMMGYWTGSTSAQYRKTKLNNFEDGQLS